MSVFLADGSLSRSDARKALRSLNGIRNTDLELRRSSGELSDRDEAVIQARLDRLSRSVRGDRDRS